MESSPTRYIVVGRRRSGTTATHLCLRGHPSVSAVHNEVGVEPFLSKGIGAFTYGEERTEEELSSGIPALFDAMTAVPPASKRKARGMKLTLPDLRLAKVFVKGMQAYLPDVRIVHVQRNDVIARFASLKKAMQSGKWHRRTQDRRQKETITIDPHDFSKHLIESIQVQQLLRDLRSSHDMLCLSYEDVILQGRLSTHAPLFRFVGVEPVEATWLRDKKLSPPPEEYVRNYSELTKMHDQIKRQLEEGTALEDLYDDYSRPLPKKLWRKATFWSRRPGYAMYRAEQGVRDFFGLRNTEGPD